MIKQCGHQSYLFRWMSDMIKQCGHQSYLRSYLSSVISQLSLALVTEIKLATASLLNVLSFLQVYIIVSVSPIIYLVVILNSFIVVSEKQQPASHPEMVCLWVLSLYPLSATVILFQCSCSTPGGAVSIPQECCYNTSLLYPWGIKYKHKFEHPQRYHGNTFFFTCVLRLQLCVFAAQLRAAKKHTDD